MGFCPVAEDWLGLELALAAVREVAPAEYRQTAFLGQLVSASIQGLGHLVRLRGLPRELPYFSCCCNSGQEVGGPGLAAPRFADRMSVVLKD
mmetsp:Transcript_4303/g.6825  ORF Transcript_4303/g.6825 Transcript_4303/m.6825 type:complete len:92 (+) Transcript_4303:105-380(+)